MRIMPVIIAIAALVIASIVWVQPFSRAEDADDKSVDDLITQAELALRQRKYREAADLATKVIEQKPDHWEAYVLRGLALGSMGRLQDSIADFTKAIDLKPEATTYLHRSHSYSELDEHAKALADIDRALKLDPKARGAHRQRGRVLFKMGEVQKSLADFDRFVELEPDHENDLWERGLSRYYAGHFRRAQQSFEDYHKVGPDDTENDLWRMLSQAEVDGLAEAQEVLKTLHARRGGAFPPLYDLYTGKLEADAALSRAIDGATTDNDRQTRTFYAHLYVGLWFVVKRDRVRAIEHLEKAVALRSTDYMWYVARLQLKRLKAASDSK